GERCTASIRWNVRNLREAAHNETNACPEASRPRAFYGQRRRRARSHTNDAGQPPMGLYATGDASDYGTLLGRTGALVCARHHAMPLRLDLETTAGSRAVFGRRPSLRTHPTRC